MLRDITIGQHFPGNSPVHRLDPRIKILLTIAWVVVLLMRSNFIGMGIAALLLVLLYRMAKIPGRMVWRSTRPLLPILLFTTILQLFFNSQGRSLVQFWVINITTGGIYNALLFTLRIVILLVGVSLLTYTTSPIALTDAIERLLSPLSRLRFPTHELAMMMTIALRFIPTLIEETDKIMSAQKARGAELDSGNFIQRIKALVPVLIPLFLSAFRRAEDLAMAMECRCYRGGEGRTRLRQLRFTAGDLLATLFCLVVLGAIGASGYVVAPPF
ncbi:energy-coupling factor transporter transmembrane protein EcfT [Ruminococcaceae bacterium OttesenSCG-928-O06]|nr:energy-coupling factor transporter transmembrane protein EcfT [Ruminococcaceae bacterium OttesenSCG-928-O06]